MAAECGVEYDALCRVPAYLGLAGVVDAEYGARFGEVSAQDYAGRWVSGAGDVNGDGLADIIAGASNRDTAAGADAGVSYVIFGTSAGAPPMRA